MFRPRLGASSASGPPRINWGQCEDSLTKAGGRYDLRRHTFVFPRNLTGAEARRFAERFGGRTPKADAWTLSDLRNLLELKPGLRTLLGGIGVLAAEAPSPRPPLTAAFAGRDGLPRPWTRNCVAAGV